MSNQKPSSPKTIPPTLHTLKARQLYEKRLKEGRNGNAEQDWEEARQYLLDHPQAIFLWWLKQGVVRSVDASGTGFKTFFNFVLKGLPTSDLAKLLAAPLILSYFGTQITNSFQEQSRQNETVNKYFEQMEQLIIDKKIDFAKSTDSVKSLIKGKSLATLRSVDNSRKAIVLSFLSESDLLNRYKQGISLSYFNLEQVNLSGFNLTGINLKNAVLVKANLEGSLLKQADLRFANLSRAKLSHAKLIGADLYGANLSEANLSEANLSRANLSRANLSEANLSRANLSGADLGSADLSGADLGSADLSGADFSGAQNLTYEQIKSACNWQKALYYEQDWDYLPQAISLDKEANQKEIDKIKQDKASNPGTIPDCR